MPYRNTDSAFNTGAAVHTFTCMTIPEYTFGIWAIALNFMDGRGSPHAADAASGEGVWQGGGGLLWLRLVQPLPGEFRGWMVNWFRTNASLGSVVTWAYEGMSIVWLSGIANTLGGWGDALQGHRVLVLFGGVHHHSIWVLLWKRLLVGIH